MPQTPLFIRRLIRAANRVDDLTQDQIRVLIVQALDFIIPYCQTARPEFMPQLYSTKDYLRAVARSRHPVHTADAKLAFIVTAETIRQMRMDSLRHGKG